MRVITRISEVTPTTRPSRVRAVRSLCAESAAKARRRVSRNCMGGADDSTATPNQPQAQDSPGNGSAIGLRQSLDGGGLVVRGPGSVAHDYGDALVSSRLGDAAVRALYLP